MSLVIVGSIGLDNVETPFGKVEEALGGSAMYASMSSRHFCETAFVGVVGEDFPKNHVEMLENNGILTKGLEIVEGKTFRWGGKYNDLNKAETLFTDLNVFADFDPKLPESYKKMDYLFLANIHPSLQLKVLEQMENPKIVALDTMNLWIDIAKPELMKVIEKVDILFINEDELKQLTEEQQVFKAAEIAQSYGPKLVIVKRGEFGAFAVSSDFLFFAPIYPLTDVVDPTGAGDCFAGGFMGYLARQDDLNDNTIRNAMIYGTVMASINIQAFSLDNLENANTDLIEERKEFIRKSVTFI